MSQTYVVCEKCGQTNRVKVPSEQAPVCGSCKMALSVHGAIVNGSDQTLQKLINKSPLPVVVDVWAPWCGPCRSFAPVFDESSKKFAGQIVFVKLNSDENQQVAKHLEIQGIPTVIVFKNGKEVARQSGAIPRDQFNQWIAQYM